MALSEGQQAFVRQKGQMAFGRMSDEFYDSSQLGPETAAEEVETEKGISGEPSTYEQPRIPGKGDEFATTPEEIRGNEMIFEKSIRKGGYTNMANALEKKRLSLAISRTDAKSKENILKAETNLMGLQMIKAGDVKGGVAIMNKTLPEGQRVISVSDLGSDKQRVITEDQPEGFTVRGDDMITAYTDAVTQYNARAAMDRLKYTEQQARLNNPDRVLSTDKLTSLALQKKAIVQEIAKKTGQTEDQVAEQRPNLRFTPQEQALVDKFNIGGTMNAAIQGVMSGLDNGLELMQDPEKFPALVSNMQRQLKEAMRPKPKAKGKPEWMSEGNLELIRRDSKGKTDEQIFKQLNANPDKFKKKFGVE